MKTQEWKLLGHFLLDRYTLAGSNIKNSIHIRVFLNAHSWQKPFQTPRAKKLSYFFFDFGLCCPPPVWFMKAQKWKFFGSPFFYRYTLARSNIKNSIHIRVFWTCTPGKNNFRPQGQKTILFFLWFWSLLSCPQSVLFREGLRIDFLGSIFFPCVPLRGFIHLNMSMQNGVFSTCIPGKNHFKKLTKIQNHQLQILNPKSKNLRSQIPKSKMWCMSTYILLYWFILCYVCLQKSNFRGDRGKPF